MQHSTSPYSNPLVTIPKTCGSVKITVNYKKLNQINKFSQLPIPRVDQVLDYKKLNQSNKFSRLPIPRVDQVLDYKKLNQINKFSQLPIPRVDQVLDYLGLGRVFSLFDLVSSFHHIKTCKDTVPLTAVCTPTGPY